jgi:hypothetical protein
MTWLNPSAACSQKIKIRYHHEGTKNTKEDFSRKGAKGRALSFLPLRRAQDKLREKSLFRARREIFFSDLSHSLEMTDRRPSLCVLEVPSALLTTGLARAKESGSLV